MDISIKNYKDIVPKEVVALAAKCSIRECDEVKKGHFEAYVDEKKESLDVSLTLGKDGSITTHTCDCSSHYDFCQHKTALLQHIAKGKKTALVAKTIKKQNPLDALVAEVDADKLRTWVMELLNKNKDLGISFTQYFSTADIKHTPEEAKKLTLDAVKSILKTRRKAEVAEVKRLVELWTEIHSPILDRVYTTLYDKENFLTLHAIVEAVEETENKLNTTSARIPKYLETLVASAADHLSLIQDDEAWLKAVTYFTNRLMNYHYIRIHYVNCMALVFEKVPLPRKMKLMEQVLEHFATLKPENLTFGDKYTDVALNMVIETDTFKQYHALFKPLYFKNEFNYKFINLFIEEDMLELAEEHALDQIKLNYKDEYNVMYLELLREIYILQEDNDKLTAVLMKMLPQTFNFDDYQYIHSQLPEGEEKKKWRTKILTRARAGQTYEGELFSFRLMDAERNYRKMIEYIGSNTPYGLIALYAEQMLKQDSNGFFNKIFKKHDSYYLRGDTDVEAHLDTIIELLHNHFASSVIQAHIKKLQSDRWTYNSNMLIRRFERE